LNALIAVSFFVSEGCGSTTCGFHAVFCLIFGEKADYAAHNQQRCLLVSANCVHTVRFLMA
jgi:hypothetical protein